MLRSRRRRLNEVKNATDYGVIPDGVTDNALPLQALVNSFPNNKGKIIVPPGIMLTSEQIDLPNTAYDGAVLIEGAGKSASMIKAKTGGSGWTGKGVIHRGAANVVIGGGLRDLSVDAASIADYGIYFQTGKQTVIEGVNVTSSVVTDGLFGDASTPRFYETKFIDCAFYCSGSVSAASRPNYNFRLTGYATDNEVFRCTAANAKLANFRADTGGNTFIGCHPFGYPSTHEADYCFDLASDRLSVVGSFCDGFTIAGVHIAGVDCSVVASRFFWPSTVTGDAILVAANRTGLAISNNIYFAKPANKAEVAYAGGLPTSSYIQSGLMYADGTRVFIGSSGSLGALNNSRFQISGTDFQGSQFASGRWSADALGPFLSGYKSRGATVGANGLVSASDQLFIIDGTGDDGATRQTAVRLLMRADGTPSAGVMPGQLDIQTTTVGTATLASRINLDSRGNVRVSPGATALVTTATDGDFYVQPTDGVPTGVPRFGDGAIRVDKNTGKLYCYSTVIGGWVAQS